jgi:predicted peroxiredoxin
MAMADVLTISTTCGPDDPTRATIPFHLARGAQQTGVKVRIVLAGDSTDLIKGGVAETVRGKGVPPFAEVLNYARDNGIQIHV